MHVWPWIKCPSTNPPLDSCGLVKAEPTGEFKRGKFPLNWRSATVPGCNDFTNILKRRTQHLRAVTGLFSPVESLETVLAELSESAQLPTSLTRELHHCVDVAAAAVLLRFDCWRGMTCHELGTNAGKSADDKVESVGRECRRADYCESSAPSDITVSSWLRSKESCSI